MRTGVVWLSAVTTLTAALVAGEEVPAQPALHASSAAAADHAASEPETDLLEEKRAWNSLHGGWGKRAWSELNSPWGKRGWQDMNSAWGKRGWQDMNSAWGKRGWQDMNSAWGKRGWQDMNSAWGKRGWQDMNPAWGKRGWQDMNSAWGKRGWRDMSSAWGKRQRSDLNKWHNFHGSWGKRSEDPAAIAAAAYPDSSQNEIVYEIDAYDQYQPLRQWLRENAESLDLDEAPDAIETPEKKAWNSLHSTWGKRSAKPINDAFSWKRQTPWRNLRNVWGKRSRSKKSRQVSNDEAERRDVA